MQIARVIGTVVSTVKNESLGGRKLLIVQTLDADLREKGSPTIALDSVTSTSSSTSAGTFLSGCGFDASTAPVPSGRGMSVIAIR